MSTLFGLHWIIFLIEMRKKQLLYSVKLSHKYYMKCMTYFAYVDWSRQTDEWCFLFLRATIELSALIKNSNPEKSKNKFLESFRPLITVLPALERLTCKSYNDAQLLKWGTHLTSKIQ